MIISERKTNKILFSFNLQKNIQFLQFLLLRSTKYIGSNNEQEQFWNDFFKFLTILPVNSDTIKKAVNIEKKLKKTRKAIDIPDLFIAATTIENSMALATLNTKHFENIENIQLITNNS